MIADFLHKPLSYESISRIAEQCTFKGMKENEISLKIRDEQESWPLLRKGSGRRLEKLLHSRAE